MVGWRQLPQFPCARSICLIGGSLYQMFGDDDSKSCNAVVGSKAYDDIPVEKLECIQKWTGCELGLQKLKLKLAGTIRQTKN